MKWTPVAASIIVAAIAIAFMVYGSTYSVPDLVRVDYGFPLRWGHNTVDTIVGVVNLWSVYVNALAIDLAFWFAILIVVSLYLSSRK